MTALGPMRTGPRPRRRRLGHRAAAAAATVVVAVVVGVVGLRATAGDPAMAAGAARGRTAPTAHGPAVALDGPRAATAAALPGEWSAPAWPLGASPRSEPSLATDRTGAAHAVWTEPGEDRLGRATTFVGYAVDAGRGWTAERLPCGWPEIAARVDCSSPTVAVDAAGLVHVVVVAAGAAGADIVHHARPAAGGRWTAGLRVNDGGDGVRRSGPVAVADALGQLHVAWADGGDGRSEVRYRQRLADGSWRDVSTINEPAAGAQTAPALVLAADGTVHAAWRDDRDGLPAIWTSMLPERSFVWWPDARISAAGHAAAGPPVVAAAANGDVVAAWVSRDGDGGAALYGARRPAAGPYWDPARAVDVQALGPLGALALAPRPDGRFVLAWTEGRPADVWRLYATGWDGQAASEGRQRLDGTLDAPRAAAPAVAAGHDGRMWLAWEEPGPAPSAALALAQVTWPGPERPWRAVEGVLVHAPLIAGCQGDGYHIVACDGETVATVLGGDEALARLHGAYVAAEGWATVERACPRLDVQRVAPRTPPCRRADAAVFGRLERDGRAASGARVHVGAAATASGRSGRFGLVGLPAAAASITATAPCALDLDAGVVALQPGQRLDLGRGSFVGGDVVADCVIDVRDLVRVARDARGDLRTAHACSDVNGDGTVNVADLDAVRRNLGRRCPQPWLPVEGRTGEPP